MTSNRIEFTEATKRIIAMRAGYRCSFPGCDCLTIGPGQARDSTITIGEAAHIFSASPGGPRGQGGRPREELESPQNGIWLCRDHGNLIDANRGEGYPEPALLSYRAQHETKISRELGALDTPFGWIEELQVVSSPVGWERQSFYFAKSTILSGANGVGKSLLCSYIATAASPEPAASLLDPVYRGGRHEFTLVFRQPDVHRMHVRVQDASIRFRFDDQDVPFNPMPFCVVEVRQGGDGPIEERLPRVSGMSRSAVQRSLAHFEVSVHGHLWSVRTGIDGDIELARDGEAKVWAAGSFSGGEQKMLLLQWATKLAEFTATRRPTVLILDDGLHALDTNNRVVYLDRLSSATRAYQTLLVDAGGVLDVPWNGWQLLDFSPSPRSRRADAGEREPG